MKTILMNVTLSDDVDENVVEACHQVVGCCRRPFW
jgi:hypothetical protein